MNCGLFKRSLYHFQADELSREERASFEEHLSACPPCARLLEVEDGLLRGLRARLQRREAPPGLETRIRAGLAGAAPRRGGLGWLRAPSFAAIATSVLLAVVLWPSWERYRTSPTVRVSETVTLVDRACDLAGKDYDAQRRCPLPEHLNALKRADGSYWDLSLDDEASRAMVTDRAGRGSLLRVEGLLYEKIHTLELEHARPIGPVSARLAFR